jgi:copper chaperone CopZ
MAELRFTIFGARCHHCFSAVKAEIAKVPGVIRVHLEPDTDWLVVEGDNFELDRIRAAVLSAGHVAQL